MRFWQRSSKLLGRPTDTVNHVQTRLERYVSWLCLCGNLTYNQDYARQHEQGAYGLACWVPLGPEEDTFIGGGLQPPFRSMNSLSGQHLLPITQQRSSHTTHHTSATLLPSNFSHQTSPIEAPPGLGLSLGFSQMCAAFKAGE